MKAATSTDTKPNDIIIKREFNTPRERVWESWTQPEQMKKWWGTKDFTAPVAEIDLRVGGKYLNCMRGPDGKDYWSTGVYQEVNAPEKLVMTDSFADADGNPVPASHYNMPGNWPDKLTVTVRFEENNGKTNMTLRHEGIPAGEMREMCAAGWNESFDKLERSFKA